MKKKTSKRWRIDQRLYDAVSVFDLKQVKKLLALGANPNYKIPRAEYADCMASYADQPYTALRLVVFRISDSMLETEDLAIFVDIAKLLLQNGANARSAMQLMEIRYGKFRPRKVPKDGRWYDLNTVLNIIAATVRNKQPKGYEINTETPIVWRLKKRRQGF
jgi:hypothetical protein